MGALNKTRLDDFSQTQRVKTYSANIIMYIICTITIVVDEKRHVGRQLAFKWQ